MDQIVTNNGARLNAKGVNSTHVAEHLVADGVEMVKGNQIAFGLIRTIPPGPADRNGSVKKIVYVVVDDLVAAALQDPDADAGGVD